MVVFFDGVCNLCSGAVQFIIKRDPRSQFRFASLQSEFAAAELAKAGVNPAGLFSILLLNEGQLFQKSDAALEITRHLAGAWPVFYAFKLLPRFLRDGVYDWVARNRYRWFGRKDACWIPSPALRARFID